MDHVDAEDIRALRRDGDLRGYLRSLTRHTTTPASTTPAAPATGYSPHHTPGAWPYGTHPTNSAICRPDCPCALHPPTT